MPALNATATKAAVRARLDDTGATRFSVDADITTALIEETRYVFEKPLRREFEQNIATVGTVQVISSSGTVPLPTADSYVRLIGGTVGGRAFVRVIGEGYVNRPIGQYDQPTIEEPWLEIRSGVAYILPLLAFYESGQYHKVYFWYLTEPAVGTVIMPVLLEPIICGAASRLAFQTQEYQLAATLRQQADAHLAPLLEPRQPLEPAV